MKLGGSESEGFGGRMPESDPCISRKGAAKQGEHITFKVLTDNAPSVLLSCGPSPPSQNRDTTDSDCGGTECAATSLNVLVSFCGFGRYCLAPGERSELNERLFTSKD